MSRRAFSLYPLLVLFALLGLPGARAVVYVNQAAPGPAHDGASWPTAFQTVQAGLDAAKPGDEVWVAAGRYVGCVSIPDGVALYGGFTGAETVRDQRDSARHETTIAQPDPNPDATPTVSMKSSTGTKVLDGFTVYGYTGWPAYGVIAEGQSVIAHNTIAGHTGVGISLTGGDNTITHNRIVGNSYDQGRGGGIFCFGGSTLIEDNLISENSAYSTYHGTFPPDGGGIYSYFGTLTIRGNVIYGNAASSGGGIACMNCTAVIEGNTICKNSCYTGGGIYCNGPATVVQGNRITGNSAGNGGGVYCLNGSTLRNNVITGNTANATGVSVVGIGGGVAAESGCVLANNTIVANTGTSSSVDLKNGNATLVNNLIAFNNPGFRAGATTLPNVVRNNCFYGNTRFDTSGLPDPVGTAGNINADPKFASYTYGNFRIQPDSPCRDAGDDSAVSAGGVDLDGQPRSQGAHVDIGADESDGTVQSAAPSIVYLKPGGSDGADGLSWATAKATLTGALMALASLGGGEIWAAAGEYREYYYPYVEAGPFTHMYGGFTGTETDRGERNWAANTTAIVVGAYTMYIGGGVAPCTVDGFLFRRTGISAYGMATIANNTVTGSRNWGIAAGPAVIVNNVVKGNAGGGIAAGPGATVVNNTVVNNTITNNTSTNSGGIAIFSPGVLENNIVASNSSGVNVYTPTGSTTAVTVRNNCVTGNAAYDYTGITDPTGADGNIKLVPGFLDLPFGDVHIRADSPCRDAGDDAVIPAGQRDIDHQSRIQGAHVDIGADESDGSGPVAHRIIRVSPSGNDANDGSSWVLAMKTIQGAIDAASAIGGEVWVAAGTYLTRARMGDFTYLYGGFKGDETARTQRDWRANLSILDGEASNVVLTLRGGGPYGAIDGFTIRNGYAYIAGGIRCDGSSPLIAHNIITGNVAMQTGAAIGIGSGSPIIRDNVIANNTLTEDPYGSTSNGAGIYAAAAARPEVIGNTIAGNKGQQVYGIPINPSALAVNVNCKVENNIIAFNDIGTTMGSDAKYTAFRSNNVFGNTQNNGGGQNGNISADPLFADRANGDYHLLAGSPCTDTGDDTVVLPGEVDLNGQIRLQGAHVDMGAYEFAQATPITMLDVTAALRAAAGLSEYPASVRQRLDVAPPVGAVDLRDAMNLARTAAR